MSRCQQQHRARRPLRFPDRRRRAAKLSPRWRRRAQRFSRKHGIKLGGFDDKATQALVSHDWPGNVRELQNTIERAVILTEPGSKISLISLGLMPRAVQAQAAVVSVGVANREMVGAGSSSGGFNGSEFPSFSDSDGEEADGGEAVGEETSFGEEEPLTLELIERQHILRTLESTNGNRTQASKILGISIRTLRNKLSIYRSDGEFIPGEES